MYWVRDISNSVFDVTRNIPFTIRQNEVANSSTPNLSWAKPFTQTGAPTFILANQFNEPDSYVMQWSFGLQREITRESSLEVTYLGSVGVHLFSFVMVVGVIVGTYSSIYIASPLLLWFGEGHHEESKAGEREPRAVPVESSTAIRAADHA